MKKVILLLVVALSVVTASAQIKVGLNGGVGIPMGTFGDVFNTGFGGGISGEYLITPNISIGLNAGIYSFGMKDELLDLFGMEDMDGIDLGDLLDMSAKFQITPITLTGKYYFITEGGIKPYAGLDLGLYSSKTKVTVKVLGISQSADAGSSTDFGLAPVVGLQFGLTDALAIDVNAKYHHIFTEGEATSFIGFNLGLVYTFGK